MQPKAKSKTVGVARQQRHFLCGDKENEAKESFALRWACLARSFWWQVRSFEHLNAYISPVIPEALEVLYGSGCCCFGVFLLFAAKRHSPEGPQAQGRILYLCIILKAMKVGKGDALRQEQGHFCILFVAVWTKRMASGGTRPAGSAFSPKKNKVQQVNNLLHSFSSIPGSAFKH